MKKSIIYSILFCLSISSIYAQSTREERRELRKEFRESLSDSQKEQLKKQRKLHKEHREAMSVTFSAEQKAIATNEDLSRIGKRKSLQPTLTEKQKELRSSQKEIMKTEKDKFKSTLSQSQLELFEKLNKRAQRGRKKGLRKQ